MHTKCRIVKHSYLFLRQFDLKDACTIFSSNVDDVHFLVKYIVEPITSRLLLQFVIGLYPGNRLNSNFIKAQSTSIITNYVYP